MCRIASFIFNPKTLEIKKWKLDDHSATMEHFSFTDIDIADSWREAHYFHDGTIECRTLDSDTHNSVECAAYIKSKWGSFAEFFNHVIPERYDFDIYLDITSADGIRLPKYIGGDLSLGSLKSAEGLNLPESIGGGLYLGSLTSAEGLNLPYSIGGWLDLGSLTSADSLNLPYSIGGWLDLGSLTSADGLRLPKSIGEGLYLSSLKSAEGLKLPDSIGGGLYLSSLASAEGLYISEKAEINTVFFNGEVYTGEEFKSMVLQVS